jgi:hypothetical protein
MIHCIERIAEGFNFINTTDLVAIQEGTYEIDEKQFSL